MLLALLPAVALAVALRLDASEPVTAALAAVALLWAPGSGFARRTGRDGLERALDAFWISAFLSVPAVLVGALTGLGGPGILATAATFTAAGHALSPRRPTWVPGRWRLGAVAVLVATVAAGWAWRDTVVRPLERHWWFAPADVEGWAGVAPRPGFGWQRQAHFGDAFRLDPRERDPFLLGPMEGPVVLAVLGPTGATMEAGGQVAQVRADIVEDAAEGPVPRYLDTGVAAIRLDAPLVAGEPLPIRLSHPGQSRLYVIPSADALWRLHGAGELRFVHYYQLLNMVEQVRWARELMRERRVTDVQPPLWSYVAAGPLALTGGELPTQNLVFLGLVALVGLAGVAAVRAWAPDAPLLATLLPAAAVPEHVKLLLEPGSAGMPDTLYTLGLLVALASLARPGARFTWASLGAQLARYPGAAVAAVMAVLAGQTRRAVAMLVVVLAVAGAFAVGGAVTGSLPGWLATVWWETFPEHWHGQADPAVLVPRVPRFFGTWLAYAALLATIDHHPSHYFLPLLHLSVVSAACTADAGRGPLVRHGVPLAGLVGLVWAWLAVPVTG